MRNRFSPELFAANTLSFSLSLRPAVSRVVLSPREIDCGLGTKLPGGTVYATVIDAPTPKRQSCRGHAIVTRYPAWPQSAASLPRIATISRDRVPCIARVRDRASRSLAGERFQISYTLIAPSSSLARSPNLAIGFPL